MAVKDGAPKGETQEIKAEPPPVYASLTLSVATQSLFNMVAVTAVSGTVLLGLLAARHF